MKAFIMKNHKASHRKYRDSPTMLLRTLVPINTSTILSTKITTAISETHKATIIPPITSVTFSTFN